MCDRSRVTRKCCFAVIIYSPPFLFLFLPFHKPLRSEYDREVLLSVQFRGWGSVGWGSVGGTAYVDKIQLLSGGREGWFGSEGYLLFLWRTLFELPEVTLGSPQLLQLLF